MMNLNNLSVQAGMFAVALGRISNVIEFNPAWHNGSGYFDAAIRQHDCEEANPLCVKLEAGALAKTTTDDGRQIIFIGTALGTAALFQQHSNHNLIIMASTDALRRAQIPECSGVMGVDALDFVFGHGDLENNNFGCWLLRLAHALKTQAEK